MAVVAGAAVGDVVVRGGRGAGAGCCEVAGEDADGVPAPASGPGPAGTGPAETGPAETGPAETGPAAARWLVRWLTATATQAATTSTATPRAATFIGRAK